MLTADSGIRRDRSVCDRQRKHHGEPQMKHARMIGRSGYFQPGRGRCRCRCRLWYLFFPSRTAHQAHQNLKPALGSFYKQTPTPETFLHTERLRPSRMQNYQLLCHLCQQPPLWLKGYLKCIKLPVIISIPSHPPNSSYRNCYLQSPKSACLTSKRINTGFPTMQAIS